MRVLHDGIWRDVEVVGLGMPDGSLAAVEIFGDTPPAPPEYTEPLFVAAAPWEPILLASEGTAIEWVDAATGVVASTSLTPTLPAGTWLLRGDVELVHTINLGFNSSEDAGRYTPGASYNREPRQPVTAMTNLTQLTGLVRLLAATPTLTGHLDLTDLTALQYVECYRAQVTSVNLTGCSSLVRLCLEQNDVAALDITPVRATLRDLRAAGMTSPGLVVTCDGDLPLLYHYCTRGNPGVTDVPVEQLAVVEQWWVYNSTLTTVGSPTSPLLNSPRLHGNSLDQASVDSVLTHCADHVAATSGAVRLDAGTNAAPSATGLAAVDALRGRGWGVQHNSAV